MNSPLDQFVQRVLVPDYPPTHPLRLPDWAGLAFDRNAHEDFAPSEVWYVLFAAHEAKHGRQPVAVIAAEDLKRGGQPIFVAPTRDAVITLLADPMMNNPWHVATVAEAPAAAQLVRCGWHIPAR